MNNLMAISPLDGRYAGKVAELQDVFSEYGLIKRRVIVEIAWLKTLCAEPDIKDVRALTENEIQLLDNLVNNFTVEDAKKVKDIEKTTNHDVKAIEYYIKDEIADTSIADLSEFVHFACTSEDINNLSHALMLKDGLAILTDVQKQLMLQLKEMAVQYKDIPMLARTHGQTASPTTVGKELAVFVSRFKKQQDVIAGCAIEGKINGAVGNYNAHLSAYPDVNWLEISRKVTEDILGLSRNILTTQIEPHDYMAELFDAIARWNNILLDLDRDIWSYISLGYFGQKTIKGEVGSSTMPHKVNPIDFENSEGNIGLANAVLHHLSGKLPVSRMQRDLTDSTVLRNMGVGFGYSLLAYKSTLKGFSKLKVNEQIIAADLDNAWEVMAEPVQTVMRKAGIEKPYEKLKELTRGNVVDRETIREFVEKLDVDEDDKKRLLAMTPASYIGMAPVLVDYCEYE